MKTNLFKLSFYLFIGVLCLTSCKKDESSKEVNHVNEVTYNSATISWPVGIDDESYALTVIEQDGATVINEEPIVPTISNDVASYKLINLEAAKIYTIKIIVTKTTGSEDEIEITVHTAPKPSPDIMINSLSKEISESLILLDENNLLLEPISETVNDGDAAIEKVKDVTSSIEEMNTTMKTIKNTAKLFKSLPVVGTVTTAVYTSVNVAQKPVGVVSDKINKMRIPTINPIESGVGSVKSSVDNIKGYISKGEIYLNRAKDIVENELFIDLVKSDEDAEKAMEEVAKYLDYMNDAVGKVNNGTQGVAELVAELINFDDSFSEIENNIRPTKNALSTVKPAFDELQKAMDYEIGIHQDLPWPLPDINISFSINDILNGVGDFLGFLDTLLDMVADYLQDILSDLGVDIPEVPGLDYLDQELNKLTTFGLGTLQEQALTLTTIDKEIIENQNQLIENIELLENILNTNLEQK